MFFRGRKVIITESNARKHTHPIKGDVGYLSNMFLFPSDRLILTDLFLCSLGKNKSARIERKKFVIDLGMSSKLKFQISHTGVNKSFFLQKPSLNLLPAFHLYRRKSKGDRSTKIICSFPQLVGTYGVWPGYMSKGKKQNRYMDSSFRIPCGQIACFNRKNNRLLTDLNELKAWIRSISANISSTLSFFADYYPSNGGNLINYVDNIWNPICWAFNPKRQYDNIDFLHFHEKLLVEAQQDDKDKLVQGLNKMNSLFHVAMCKLTSNLLNENRLSEVENGVRMILDMDQLDDFLKDKWLFHDSHPVAIGRFVVECLYRALMVDFDTQSSLGLLRSYFPLNWEIDNLIKRANIMKEAADLNSAALNHVYEVLYLKKGVKRGREIAAESLNVDIDGNRIVEYTINM